MIQGIGELKERSSSIGVDLRVSKGFYSMVLVLFLFFCFLIRKIN